MLPQAMEHTRVKDVEFVRALFLGRAAKDKDLRSDARRRVRIQRTRELMVERVSEIRQEGCNGYRPRHRQLAPVHPLALFWDPTKKKCAQIHCTFTVRDGEGARDCKIFLFGSPSRNREKLHRQDALVHFTMLSVFHRLFTVDSIPVATTDTRTFPVSRSSHDDPKMMFALSSTSLRILKTQVHMSPSEG